MHFSVAFMLIIMSGNGACRSLNEMNVYSVFDSLTLDQRSSTSVEIPNQYYSLYLRGRFKLLLLTHPVVGIVVKRNYCKTVVSLRFGKPSKFPVDLFSVISIKRIPNIGAWYAYAESNVVASSAVRRYSFFELLFLTAEKVIVESTM